MPIQCSWKAPTPVEKTREAGQVVQAVDNPDSSIDDICSLIQQDAAIAASD